MAGADATDLTFESVGGTETSIDVRMNVWVTSDWTTTRGGGGGANVGWTIGTAGAFTTVLSGAATPTGSESTCYTTPWVTVPVGPALDLRYYVEGAAIGGTIGVVSGQTSHTVTMPPGCSDFIEIQESGFTYDSAELGIENGQFIVPKPAAAGLLLTGLTALAVRRRRLQ